VNRRGQWQPVQIARALARMSAPAAFLRLWAADHSVYRTTAAALLLFLTSVMLGVLRRIRLPPFPAGGMVFTEGHELGPEMAQLVQPSRVLSADEAMELLTQLGSKPRGFK
jgi:hypothetical protein